MALSLATGANAAEAAYLSNVAAGEVVKKFGTAVTNIAEMETAVKSLLKNRKV
jgi:bifunctional ADP-heptose synthase (sugar kinase/adenylyltransferase)